MSDSVGQQALADLQRAYANPLAAAREASAKGEPVVGLIGPTIPVELVLASGRFPVTLTPPRGVPTPAADAYMEEVAAPETRSFFELAVSGELEFLDLLILSRHHSHLYYYLKEVYRLGRGRHIPPQHIYDLMQSRREAVRAYNWGRTTALVTRLEQLSGQSMAESAVRSAVALINKKRALQRQVLERRWSGGLRGVEAMQVIGAGSFMHPNSYVETMTAYLDRETQENKRRVPRLLVISSEPLAYLDLHQTLEAEGATVIAEDDCWGSRAPGDDVPLTGVALDGILQKYWLDTAGEGVYPAQARQGWLKAQALRPEVDGVVFYVPPSDHQFGWDYPALRDWLTELGKPQLLLRWNVTDPEGRLKVQAPAAEFIGALSKQEAAVWR